ncbi:MAG: hypothetical protein ACTSRP_19435 [Candidatus Helarchaeota archaeon]
MTNISMPFFLHFLITDFVYLPIYYLDEFTNIIKELIELNNKYSLGLSNKIEDFKNKLKDLTEERNAME